MSASMGDLLSAFNLTPPSLSEAVSPDGLSLSPGVGRRTAASTQNNSRASTPSTQNGDITSAERFTTPLNGRPSPAGGDDSFAMDLDDEAANARTTNTIAGLSAMMEEDLDAEQAVFDTDTHSRGTYQNIVRQKARKYGLQVYQQTELLEFCELTPVGMLIDIKIHQMRTDNDIIMRFMRLFVRHPDFQVRLQHIVAAALLSPSIPTYLDGLTIQFTKYLEDNAENLLGVASAQKADPADWKVVKKAIVGELSGQRSNMKLKIETSIKNKQDIYDLTTALMMYDMRPKKEHWGRFAFLRRCTVMFYQMPTRSRTEYWKYIDKCLLDVRQSAQDAHPHDPKARKMHETMFIARVLENDVKEYPLKSGAMARTVYTNEALPQLQSNIEKLVLGFTGLNDPAPGATTQANDDSRATALTVDGTDAAAGGMGAGGASA